MDMTFKYVSWTPIVHRCDRRGLRTDCGVNVPHGRQTPHPIGYYNKIDLRTPLFCKKCKKIDN